MSNCIMISKRARDARLKIEKQYQALVIGSVLYAFQASQSIVRAIPYQLDELKEFYAKRPKPRDLANQIWVYAGLLRNASNGFIARHFTNKQKVSDDLYMLSRLLYDFAYLLETNVPILPDAANLWYCLGMSSLRLSKRIAGFPKTYDVNIFNRSEYLPPPLEIEDIVSESWWKVPEIS